jgi:S1-C subfamily serine protease
MTKVIISALARSLPSNDAVSTGASCTIPDVIQTDAPINSGNSAGVQRRPGSTGQSR